ncbi:MAG: hypothetical protein MPJ78_02955 [Hyphomicrobiaceae bacterium]|nr:hypothetical protein [Hyphomicrobiaceae bacterium]
MSSPDNKRRKALRSRRQALALIGSALLAAPLASACQPLYGSTPNGARVKDVMAGIDITEIPGRVGQRLRNELIFSTTGGGRAGGSVYRLEISVRESLTKTLVSTTGDAQGEIYFLEANYKLVSLADNKIVFRGKGVGRAAYDRFNPIFSNVRARIDAENRAARIVADTIRTGVAGYLSGQA